MFETIEQGLESLYKILSSVGNGIATIVTHFDDFVNFIFSAINLSINFILHFPQYCLWVPSEVVVLALTVFSFVAFLSVKGFYSK